MWNNSAGYTITTYSPKEDRYPDYGIIFLGGAWHNVENYDEYLTSIAINGTKVVAVPYPGHKGAPQVSAKAFKSLSFTDYVTVSAQNIRIVMESDPTRHWLIVAHSMGSLVLKEAIKHLHSTDTTSFDKITGVILQAPAGPRLRVGGPMMGFFISQIPKLPSGEVIATDRQISKMFFNGASQPEGFTLQPEPLKVVAGCIRAVLQYKKSEGFYDIPLYIFESDQDLVSLTGTGGDIVTFRNNRNKDCFLKTVRGNHEYAITNPEEAALFTVKALDVFKKTAGKQ